MHVAVDHLVIAAASLEQGVRWCEATLGVTPGPGGRHALMGTHNRLLKIASEAYPASYLEIIAIDPEAPPPGRVRWFGLDDPALQARLAAPAEAGGGPRLIHWVGRSPQLDMHRWGLMTLGLQPGDPIAAGRETPEGPLRWQILVRPDGQLLCGGALPTLIEWQGRHPTASMADAGVTLHSLSLSGLPPRARELLRLRQVGTGTAGDPPLSAVLRTPRGELRLDGGAPGDP
jgi:hypothetical protein